MQEKRCTKCGEVKPLHEFQKKGDNRRRADCRACAAAYNRTWQRKNPEKLRKNRKKYYERHQERLRAEKAEWQRAHPEQAQDAHLRRTFGITLDQYRGLQEKQGGKCAVCDQEETAVDKRTGKVRRLHVDHSHQSGAVRGLLCTRCNLGLGFLQEDPKIIKSLLQYLDRE
jgi:hypothetical protein